MKTILLTLESWFKKGYNFVFHKNFLIPTFTRSKLSVNRNTKIYFKKLDQSHLSSIKQTYDKFWSTDLRFKTRVSPNVYKSIKHGSLIKWGYYS